MPVMKRSARTVSSITFSGDTTYQPNCRPNKKRKAGLRANCTITINLLELWGMVVTVWMMLEFSGDKPVSVRHTLAMRGDKAAPVTCVNMCGGARDKRACLLMRMLGCLEPKGG